jgi:hypothetical protein
MRDFLEVVRVLVEAMKVVLYVVKVLVKAMRVLCINAVRLCL